MLGYKFAEMSVNKKFVNKIFDRFSIFSRLVSWNRLLLALAKVTPFLTEPTK